MGATNEGFEVSVLFRSMSAFHSSKVSYELRFFTCPSGVDFVSVCDCDESRMRGVRI